MARDLELDMEELLRRRSRPGQGGGGGERRRTGGGGSGGGDDEGGPSNFPQLPRLPQSASSLPTLILVGALLLIGALALLAYGYTEWLWFQEVGYATAWITAWTWRTLLFGLGLAMALLVLCASWFLARTMALRNTVLAADRAVLSQIAHRPRLALVALVISFGMAQAFGNQWLTLLQYLNARPWNRIDPVFGLDISFYIFELPALQFLLGWTMNLLFIAFVGSAALYGLAQLQWLRDRSLSIPDPARRHLALLIVPFLALWALGRWLHTFELVYSSRGVAFGASYTDVTLNVPVLGIETVLLVLVALAVLLNLWRPFFRLPLIPLALWFLVTLVGGQLIPGFFQRYAVEPNELALERPYLEAHIAMTRQAYNLETIQIRPFEANAEITAEDLETNPVARRNIRLWDYRPLLQTYNQLQALRPYYAFNDVDIDRYPIDGEMRQVMLAGREMDRRRLPAQSWVNQRLEYTHGYGVVMNPVNVVTPEGRPDFFVRDLPPVGLPGLEVRRPELYFGELTNQPVFVNSGYEEFDYPRGDQNVYTRYEGTGGIPFSGLLTRVAFALRLQEPNLLLSQYITDDTRVMMRRTIQARIQHIAPFLHYDSDPYLVINTESGNLVWIQDAYTVSDRYPYAARAIFGEGDEAERINYIRNAVKVTVDAYHGTVDFYISDVDDPLIQTYAAIFPGMFKPMEQLAPTLESHLRYPEDLFSLQSELLGTYHMTDVQVFYNKEDQWMIATELREGQSDGQDQTEAPIEPYYVVLNLPGEAEQRAEFLLIRPYTPLNRANMVAWLAARNDPPHRGELVVYVFPKQGLIFGPSQIEARINQSPQISSQLTLWGQVGSRVIRGNMLVLPINDAILYVEPLYIVAETGQLPELQRIIVASSNRVVMLPTLDEALAALVSDQPTAGAAPLPSPSTGTPPATTDVNALIVLANQQYNAAEEARIAGDWTAYGVALGQLEETLAILLQVTGQAPTNVPTTPTPTPFFSVQMEHHQALTIPSPHCLTFCLRLSAVLRTRVGQSSYFTHAKKLIKSLLVVIVRAFPRKEAKPAHVNR